MGPAIVTATVDIYQAIKKELLPTPAKSHYTYNMRDLSKVFQGISSVGVPVDTPEKMARWVLLVSSATQLVDTFIFPVPCNVVFWS